MHKNKVIKIVAPIAILAVAVVAALLMIGNRPAPEQEEQKQVSLLVDVMEAEPRDIRFSVQTQGAVKPKLQAELISEVQGAIVAVSPKFVNGGFFKHGDVLVSIDPADYRAALHSAEAELMRAKANLQEEQARAKVAELDWKNYSPDKTPELGLRKPQLAREVANVRSAQAAYDRAKRDLDATEIRAPYDGIVYRKQVDLGQFVSIGGRIGTIYGTDIAEVRLPVLDDELAYLEMPFIYDHENASMPQVSLSATVAGQPLQWQARLKRSEGIIDETNRVVYLVAEVSDPYGLKRQGSGYVPLKFGRFVSAEISGQLVKSVYAIPRHLLRRGEQILLVDEARKLTLKDVTVARYDADFAYITAGLSPGDWLAITPISNPLEGMLVRLPGDKPESSSESGSEEEALAIATADAEAE